MTRKPPCGHVRGNHTLVRLYSFVEESREMERLAASGGRGLDGSWYSSTCRHAKAPKDGIFDPACQVRLHPDGAADSIPYMKSMPYDRRPGYIEIHPLYGVAALLTRISLLR